MDPQNAPEVAVGYVPPLNVPPVLAVTTKSMVSEMAGPENHWFADPDVSKSSVTGEIVFPVGFAPLANTFTSDADGDPEPGVTMKSVML
jgi:hypothetical protein